MKWHAPSRQMKKANNIIHNIATFQLPLRLRKMVPYMLRHQRAKRRTPRGAVGKRIFGATPQPLATLEPSQRRAKWKCTGRPLSPLSGIKHQQVEGGRQPALRPPPPSLVQALGTLTELRRCPPVKSGVVF
ncbi:conserved hypothetical protein, unlikely [Trypanosoma brucei gambiense DAL972]|uniref:Uncharacterized protein n=1 Tax=Trypanosoma brucei gambiense (strain MHOM/CI/86/DAL972) TaxID=679716 RepID=D0A4M7_TRYB9|nr:conserved hypothetical protein, unlikely [Trypanosoma brucei gambiense DAL972]CBH16221.1 conserved hypothetical protein, unlikely [Trypanosoma brucei gambiense DAL972]|eukprot:XP_011778485.1 conserved hypothetical protein, unlikely [Trypanosoma brucei gambiense DAL972]